jgi:hypothetical protein
VVDGSGSGSGSGGGGGVAVDAIGYVEIGDGRATYRPIDQPFRSPRFLFCSAVSAGIVIRALAHLFRR